MSSLLPPPRMRPQEHSPDVARTLDMLATTVILVLAVAILYLAREIFVPVAIAVILSFVLSPPVKLLRRIGIGKTPAVGIVVVAAFCVAVGLGAILANQVSDLAADAPKYQATVLQKVVSARSFITSNPLLTKINALIANVSAPPLAPAAPDKPPQTEPKPEKSKPQKARDAAPRKPPEPAEALAPKQDGPVQVEVVSPAPGVLTILQTVVGMAASPLATAAFVAIFIVFILIQREDLRNRFIRLMGSGDLQRTTLALTEAARRLSRYFLAQVLLNTAFGVLVAVGLAIIGVPSAILWGIVAIFMRFIPYVGSIGAVMIPLGMAAAAGSGWRMVVETALLFAILEVVTSQVVEPLVYGRNTGISPIAVVLSATFWTWLWGPVGLVLSTPLTVCLVVIGRHVERLAFLDVLLGDAPPLTQIETFYQRMLAGDPSEILDHADSFLQEHSMLDYCDQVAMKALLMAQVDVRRAALDETRQLRIRDTMRDLAEDIADRDVPLVKLKTEDAPAALQDGETGGEKRSDAEDSLPRVEIAEAWKADKSVICVAGRTALDEAAVHLLADLLKERGIGTHVEPAESLTSNALGHLAGCGGKLVILSFLDADLSVAQARFAVRRLRRQLPNLPLVAAFWMPEDDEARITGLCDDVRCDTCVSSLPEAIRLCLERAAKPAAAAAGTSKTVGAGEEKTAA